MTDTAAHVRNWWQRFTTVTPAMARRMRESAIFFLLVTALVLQAALATYNAHHPERQPVGPLGAHIAAFFFYCLGRPAFLLPPMLILPCWLLYRQLKQDIPAPPHVGKRLAGFITVLLASSSLAAVHLVDWPTAGQSAGGVLGAAIGRSFLERTIGIGSLGATLVLFGLWLEGLLFAFNTTWSAVISGLHDWVFSVFGLLSDTRTDLQEPLKALPNPTVEFPQPELEIPPAAQQAPAPQSAAQAAPQPAPTMDTVRRPPPAPAPRPAPVRPASPPPRPAVAPATPAPVVATMVPSAAAVAAARLQASQLPLIEPGPDELPPLDLLDDPPAEEILYEPEVLEQIRQDVVEKLEEFKIKVEVKDIQPGPVVTRLELRPAAGVKAAQITGLSRDLARALKVLSVRVVEVIQGTDHMGLEVANDKRQLISLGEIFRSQAYAKMRSPLSLGLGKDISGKAFAADLARMPHLLIAGTTGSGKSVTINAMILSLLYKARPEDVRLIMIDPKMLELSVYADIPHLLTPVVTDMRLAANALRWCVQEMDERFKVMSKLGVRNLSGYNTKVRESIEGGAPILDPVMLDAASNDPSIDQSTIAYLTPKPNIVVIIDELADLMMIAGKKTEELIARLAQKARAAGIHLVLATQRPSVDVITGLIKANIPCRVAFQVSSKVDSRTILDQMGAETLLGHGDMLYLPAGTSAPVRVHGAFVSDEEVHRVVDWLRQMRPPDYNPDVLNGPRSLLGEEEEGGGAAAAAAPSDASDLDALYDEAVRIVTTERKPSISYVQRRLKIGYNRAARILESMERDGVVGPLQPDGKREVLAAPPPPPSAERDDPEPEAEQEPEPESELAADPVAEPVREPHAALAPEPAREPESEEQPR